MADSLRQRIIDALTEPDTLRFVNAGALEEELWTEAEWRDEYATDLQCELDAMESEGTLASIDTYGMKAYHLVPDPEASE